MSPFHHFLTYNTSWSDIVVLLPFRILLPRIVTSLLVKWLPFSNESKRDSRRRWFIPINYVSGPVSGVLLLWAAQCIGWSVIRDGVIGSDGIKPLDIMALFISLVRKI